MTNQIYTAIAFAPVQGFIEKSRKLRDLYGSSYLLSYLSWVICNDAESKRCEVISPASPNVTQGMPNQIIIKGDYKEKDAEAAFNTAWKCVTHACQEWIEKEINDGWEYKFWKRDWGAWTNYAWEFFWVQSDLVEGDLGKGINDVRQRLNEKKRSRAWTGINWQGESSTLSGADGIAYPKRSFDCNECDDREEKAYNPKKYNYQAEKAIVKKFFQDLSDKLGENFIDPDEELSIPELIKRLITHELITDKLQESLRNNFSNVDILVEQLKKLSEDLSPRSFKYLSRQDEEKYWTCWFQGDGDKAGDYLKKYPEKTTEFSKMMREWGKDFQNQNKSPFCRVIYAGGDDFLGVFYDVKEGRILKSNYCVNQFSKFKSEIWNKSEKKPITASVGFVWAAPGIPQRDVLQHCREAEKSAKNKGRDRIAFRVLFNNGNHLEWVCPWELLESGLLASYCDREGKQNWTHIYNDVAVLESRHAFNKESTEIALGLLEIYFPTQVSIDKKDRETQVSKNTELKSYWRHLVEQQDSWWNIYDLNEKLIKTGILGDRKNSYKDDAEEIDSLKVNKALNHWIINLAKVGFHLCQQ
ncbi:Cas10/Cmr2 second palm domain-containing protein [Nostoc sp. 'Peltigera membranacea cyanobiont' 232]|uniref:Cas10/Cmr2 second palm domain-containing protein n=1 Tax=Nostoc sp. 'Peltigera membranacea cyanobiont' 232 TaxID=2014531 RepID=UPI000B95B872|nr:type III-B CRISPR-associated protein Cas10/Cmr2 [Nostoc sp. 'Peltigera membranacea cyanobiont' 232]OYE01589.1 CRISPR-associated protein [Nostoc sp. 'Peltigera membranacea cyanobiont' 232]